MAALARATNGALMKRPVLGLLAWITVLLWTPLAHALFVAQLSVASGAFTYLLSFLIGLAGWILVWKGFSRDELPATIFGFMGGGLIWLGWMEGSLEFLGHWLNPEPLMYMGVELFTANLLLLQATGVFLIAMLIWLGSNKDTHCRMFMWFHRNFKLTPARRTADYKRQYSRIVALEVIMLNWFFYVLILVLFDPRILGPLHPATFAAGGIIFAWSMWLLFFRMTTMPTPAGAIRYAVPCANIFWYCVESGSAWQLYREPWVRPFEYPITNTLILLAFIAGLVWFYTREKVGPSNQTQATPAT